MISKIISFPSGHFETSKQPPLTSLMIVALSAACKKQIDGIAFGPVDIKGSFGTLIRRGLVIRKDVTVHNHTKSLWQVTAEAVELLKAGGVEISH